jgi:hypothetical protein
MRATVYTPLFSLVLSLRRDGDGLSLTLLVLRVLLADHADDTLALDDLAVVAHPLD